MNCLDRQQSISNISSNVLRLVDLIYIQVDLYTDKNFKLILVVHK